MIFKSRNLLLTPLHPSEIPTPANIYRLLIALCTVPTTWTGNLCDGSTRALLSTTRIDSGIYSTNLISIVPGVRATVPHCQAYRNINQLAVINKFKTLSVLSATQSPCVHRRRSRFGIAVGIFASRLATYGCIAWANYSLHTSCKGHPLLNQLDLPP